MKGFGKLFIAVSIFSALIISGGCVKHAIKGKAESKVQQTNEVAAPVVKKPAATTTAKGISTPEISIRELKNKIKNASLNVFKDVHFDFDKAIIKNDDLPLLNNMAQWLIKHPRVKVRIEGNCDERGTEEYNIALGWRRANVVKNYFLAAGVSEDQISTVSYGKDRPLDPAHNPIAWAKNRRDHFTLMIKQ